MKHRKIVRGTALLLCALLLIGVYLFIRVYRYPKADEILPIVHSVLETNNYHLALQSLNDVTYVPPPFFVRLWGATRDIGGYSRPISVTVPYQHGYVCKYSSGNGKEVQVAVDVRGERVYQVTLIGDASGLRLFSELSNSLKTFRMPVNLERKP